MKEHDIVILTKKTKGVPKHSIGAIVHCVLAIPSCVVEFEVPGKLPVVVTVQRDNLRLNRTCIYCGCMDSRACAGGCSWVVTFQFGDVGVCSNCIAPHKPFAEAMEMIKKPTFEKYLGKALQDEWNDHCGDTGCFPTCFHLSGKTLTADFIGSQFVMNVAQQIISQSGGSR